MFIYKITNKVNGKIYVGLTTHTLQWRWKKHILAAANCDEVWPLLCAIRKYGKDAFTIAALEECSNIKKLKAAEKRWIKKLATYKFGYNATLGGDGIHGYKHNHEKRLEVARKAKDKITIGVRLAYKRPEVREALLLAKSTPAYKKRHSEAVTAAMARPDVKEKYRKGIDSPAARAKISEALRKAWATPEYREKRKKIEQKRKDAARAATQTPAYRKKMRGIALDVFSRAEVKVKISAAQKAAWADPVIRTKRIAAIRDAAEKRRKSKA